LRFQPRMNALQRWGRGAVRGAALAGGIWLIGAGPHARGDTEGLARAGLPSSGPRVVAFAGPVALVGTERGLYRWSDAEARWVALLAGAPIDDLAVLGSEILIAAEGDLYRWAPTSDVPQRLPLPPGAQVRSVAADARGRGWAAGEAGLFACPREGGAFEQVAGAPAAPVAVRAAGNQVWVSADRALWKEGEDGAFVRELAGLTDGWWELRGAVETAGATWLAVPEGLWHLDASGPQRRPLGAALVGAVPSAGGVAVVAEDALYCFPAGEAPAALPSAASLTGAVAGAAAPGGIGVLEAGGVRSVACPVAQSRTTAPIVLELPPPAQVVALQRAMLAHLDLEPGRLRAAETRARRRARLPEVALSLSGDMARAREHGRDQNVTTGRINDLVDASRARDGGGEVRLELSWELWREAEPDALLAISRERRELVELREQILERFNRAYFELWRTRARLASAAPGSSERIDLEVRVRELGAVLDAWTGGAFSRLEGESAGARRVPSP
jgi:hypothetical protein